MRQSVRASARRDAAGMFVETLIAGTSNPVDPNRSQDSENHPRTLVLLSEVRAVVWHVLRKGSTGDTLSLFSALEWRHAWRNAPRPEETAALPQ
jgi:hypothetical protein